MTTTVRLAILLVLLASAARASAQAVTPTAAPPGGAAGPLAPALTAPAARVDLTAQAIFPPALPAADAPVVEDACPGNYGPAAADSLGLRARAEYLLWWTKGNPLPALLTTGPAGAGRVGVIGDPSTTVLFGGTNVDNGAQHGARFTVGLGNTAACCCGLEADFFFLGGHATHFNASDPVLARPFFNANTNTPDSLVSSLPGSQNGNVRISTLSTLLGAGFHIRERLFSGGDILVDGLGGYRYLHQSDRLQVLDSFTVSNTMGITDVNGGNLPFNTIRTAFDRFETDNDFHGVDLGAVSTFNRGPLFLEVVTKLALGVTHRTVDVSGTTVTARPGEAVVTNLGGVLALSTNIMRRGTSTFAVVPELGLNLGYHVRDNLRVFVGYDLLYWSHVSRTGDQIDPHLNTSQLAGNVLSGPRRPEFVVHDSDYWAQGITFGLEVNY
jgi:hypothetical protein